MKMPLLLLLALLGAIDGETGALRVRSQPGTEVVWEGVSLGNTDTAGFLTVSDIPPGTFSLALRKTGFREFQTSITVAAGETLSLDRELTPLTSLPTVLPPKQPSGTETTLGDRTKPVSSGQDNRLNQILKSAPEPGPLPVWPAASRPAPEKAATVVPVWPFVLGGGLVIVVFWLSRRLRPAVISRAPALLAGSDVPPPRQPAEKTAAFLSDLKKREELLEQGVEIVPERAKRPVIDLDSASVREVEEK